jgi:ATP-binding cassette, subfamily A (ABC1), member 3
LNIGISNIANRQIMSLVLKKPTLDSPLSWDVAGPSLVFLAASIPLYWILLFVYESKLLEKCIHSGRDRQNLPLEADSDLNIDEDIVEEENRVASINDDTQMPVKVNRIRKYYGNSRAVQRVSFGLEYGECFALLGVSGAGKTTTFKCLTGEEIPSAG